MNEEVAQQEEHSDEWTGLSWKGIQRIIDMFWRTSHRLSRRERKKERKAGEESLSNPLILTEEQVPLESFKGIQQKLIESYEPYIVDAISATYRQAYSKYRKGILLRLSEDFNPVSDTGNMDDIIPGCFFDFYRDSFSFSIGSMHGCTIQSLTVDRTNYIELGRSDIECLTTFAYLALSLNDLKPFYMVLVDFIARLLPFNPGEVQLTGYGDVVEKCENIITYDNPLTMKRNILLQGPPGCGKSMILKQVALNHPEFVRCNLTKTDRWLGWLKLFAMILSECDKRMLVLIDEIDELGLSREKDGGSVYELLRVMDGMENTRNLIILATTNRVEDLDPALLRPGRFGPLINVDKPSVEQKIAIVDYYAERYGAVVDSERVVNSIEARFSGADIRVAFEDCLIEGSGISTENVIKNLSMLVM